MTMMGLDVETIEHLDFDFEPPCEADKVDCDKAAEWKIVLSCCGETYLLCDPHKVRLVRWFKVTENLGGVTHTSCMDSDTHLMIVERI